MTTDTAQRLGYSNKNHAFVLLKQHLEFANEITGRWAGVDQSDKNGNLEQLVSKRIRIFTPEKYCNNQSAKIEKIKAS
jgi:hypothetical protein